MTLHMEEITPDREIEMSQRDWGVMFPGRRPHYLSMIDDNGELFTSPCSDEAIRFPSIEAATVAARKFHTAYVGTLRTKEDAPCSQ